MLEPTILEVENLVVKYGDGPSRLDLLRHRKDTRFTAVDHVSFTLPEGGAVGIVGESGSGKSSVLRAIMGLNAIDSGNIRYEGHIINMGKYTTRQTSMQMVFQDPGTALDPMMTVGQTIGEVLRVHKLVERSKVEQRVAELLDMVALPASLAQSYPRDMSGGQKQRAAIARALAFKPKVLIGDELTSALDVVVQVQVLDLLKRLRTELGMGLLVVTHNLDLVRYLCEEAVVVHNGTIAESGPVENLFLNPQAPYTRELLAAAPKIKR
ncbi:MAG: ATP-binding cassette domain-containing protein [Bifidobacterium tibiigranuli]|jgi:ABC-type glutathione transport system ATPase component|uniref:ABC transporter ATP-binding protein n=1 Tax=Bifidobacterium tibiigranuli TaxID=2172043 RepID=UPI0026ED66B1|nr:ATP-binding cassette domain-containing protein [Bifidobacterium tibiigranuli]MCI1674579.1 ATP-binding cassette domain-containing protein [Bifidobacterium tibiigranuli]MCI1714133.1 ATP-binding cassette domain-containing protein [Bifidobacterium tibiigranuli]